MAARKRTEADTEDVEELREQTNDAAAAAAEEATKPAKKFNETVPGGRYLVNGRLVNAHGQPIEDEK